MAANAHNLSYYQTFYSQLKNLEKNIKFKNKTESYYFPISFAIERISRLTTNYVFYPALNKSFLATSKGLIRASQFFSSSFSQWLDDTLHDPVSTKTLIKMGEWVQLQSERGAKQEPITIPLLRNIHICSIMFARYLYIFSKDINTFLKIPQAIHSYMDWNTIKMPPKEMPKTYLAQGWKLVKVTIKTGADTLLSLIYRILKLAENILHFVPFADPTIGYIGYGLNRARHYLHQKLIKKAHEVIDRNEKRIRQKVMGSIAEIASRKAIEFTLSSTLKGALLYGIYQGSKWAALELTGNHELPDQVAAVSSFAIKVLGAILWIKCITPTLQKLHDDYRDEFDPSASTLKELVYSINRHNLSKVIHIIQCHL